MNTAEKIFEEVRSLPEFQSQQVLDFVGFLKYKQTSQLKNKTKDLSEFDQFGAVFDGNFNRGDCYDRQIIR